MPGLPATGASNTAVLFKRAQVFFRQGQYPQASNLYRQIVALNPEHADAMHYLGLSLIELGQTDAGLQRLHRSISLRPEDAIYCNNLALSLEKLAQSDEVDEWYWRALELEPDYTDAVYNFAKYLSGRKRYRTAATLITRYVGDDSIDTGLVLLLGEVYAKLDESVLAQKQMNKALELSGDVGTVVAVAICNQILGNMESALAGYNRGLELQPDEPKALHRKADLLERLNRLDESHETLTQAMVLQPESIELNIVAARICRRQKKFDEAEQWIRRAFPLSDGTVNKHSYYYELGNILDKTGDYNGAYVAYVTANDSVSQDFILVYDKTATQKRQDAYKAAFTRDSIAAFRSLVGKDMSGPQPLFIVGFPRSGTTLTERILNNHPSIMAGGELHYMQNIEASICNKAKHDSRYPGCLKYVTGQYPGVFAESRDYYLSNSQGIGLRSGDHHWFTDKMPMNETRMGLIHSLFPNSPLIHLVRHPLDVCLSTFFNELSHGEYCALKLEATAFHYLHTMEMVNYYLSVMEPRFLRVRYEDLVTDTEVWARKMIDLAGEEWNDRCLDTSNSNHIPRTASYAQVNEKIYDSSMFRYKNYREQVEPIISMLEPIIKELGYDI